MNFFFCTFNFQLLSMLFVVFGKLFEILEQECLHHGIYNIFLFFNFQFLQFSLLSKSQIMKLLRIILCIWWKIRVKFVDKIDVRFQNDCTFCCLNWINLTVLMFLGIKCHFKAYVVLMNAYSQDPCLTSVYLYKHQ